MTARVRFTVDLTAKSDQPLTPDEKVELIISAAQQKLAQTGLPRLLDTAEILSCDDPEIPAGGGDL